MKYLFKTLQAYAVTEPVYLSVGEKLRSALAAFASIVLVGAVSAWFISGSALPLMIVSIGASAVLVFTIPTSPLAQPWPLLAGNLIAAFIGVSCAKLVPYPALAGALAIGLTVLAMLATHSLHPPGGGVALLGAMGGESIHALGYQYIWLPFSLNLLVLLIAALLFNNLLPGRSYPLRPYSRRDNLHRHDDPLAMQRMGISSEDLHQALKNFDTYLPVSEADLDQIYKMAGMQAYRRRMGEILCSDIMSRDLVTADFGTSLEEAWGRLRFHRIKALPVIDDDLHVIGIITLVDFLKRADLNTYATLQERLVKLLRRAYSLIGSKPEVVGQIMSSPVHTARKDAHIVELVPLLSEKGLHHIPIVDVEDRLIGMVTQSDLIAALYAGGANI